MIRLLLGIQWLAISGHAAGKFCRDPAEVHDAGVVITECSKDDFRQWSWCRKSCALDYHSTNSKKSKTLIVCTCEGDECTWVPKVEFQCRGPCRAQTALYPKVNYFFKISKDYSTEKDMINAPTNAVLVLASVKATEATTAETGWTLVVRFKGEMPDTVSAYSSQLDTEWNCKRNILYLRPREHLKVLEKKQFVRTRVMFTGITGAEMKEQLVTEAKKQSLMWFDSYRGGEDANCLHYDFEYGEQFCDEVVTTTVTSPTTGTTPTTPTTGTTPTFTPTTVTTPTTATKHESSFSCEGQGWKKDCTLALSDGTAFVGGAMGGIVEFKGIRYAEAPVGDLRWKAPVLVKSYDGTVEAKDFAPGCAGNNWDGVDEKFAEDCLTVNVNVGENVLKEGRKVPIVYYIHGGGFNSGSNKANMRGLILDQDVMVISIAYRLGIYGFLKLPETESDQDFSANWGILDQNAAMEWAQTWAPYFGGDPSQATLNGCSAGSESIWWHLTTEMSWNYFHRAVTVGIGLNSAYDEEMGNDLFSSVISNSNCDDVNCLRQLEPASVAPIADAAKKAIFHPIKPVLEPGFGPIVDGKLLVDQLVNSVRNGHLKKNTPISFNYAKHDAWSFAFGAFKALQRVPAISAQAQEIREIQRDTGFIAPSDYFDQWMVQVYGDEAADMLEVFGCSSETNVIECRESFTRFLTASAWACNSRWALNGVLLNDRSYGPIYPMQFEIPTCEVDETTGENTKTCHCSEGSYINGNVRGDQITPEHQDIVDSMKAAWGQFYKTGTFPDQTVQDYRDNNGKFNVINRDYRMEMVFEEECRALDKVDNYLWDKWSFDETATTVQPTRPTLPPTTRPTGTPPTRTPPTRTTPTGTPPPTRTTGTSGTPDPDSPLTCEGDRPFNQKCTLTLSDGTKFTGSHTNGVVEFRGVRYAQAPVDTLRWKAPVLVESYNGESIDAFDYGPGCASNKWDGQDETFSEDCLTVNINVAKSVLERGEKVPIVFYIHGGGFNSGSNKANMKSLITDQGVMVISIAYRLGIYGFLKLPETESDQDFSANWGILDQNAAMEWAQTWAPHFGGDPSQATLNGCSAGSESIWWHLTTEMSWNYFHRAVTVGIGLNSAYSAKMGNDLYTEVLSASGCNDLNCLRSTAAGSFGDITKSATDAVYSPIKLVTEPGFGPVIDGELLVDQLINSVRTGRLKKNCPISWNYARNDAWSMTGGAFRALQRVPKIGALEEEIRNTQRDTGFKIPSDYFDQWLREVYGEKADDLISVFGCSDPDGPIECVEPFDRFLTSSSWACNSRWALNGVVKDDRSYGPIYPMQFEIPTCEMDESTGKNTKTCHCSEGSYINGNVRADSIEPEHVDIVESMKAAWGQFYKTGTFPDGTVQDYRDNDGKFNVIDRDYRMEMVFEEECAALDQADNYLWDKWEFEN